MDADTLYHSTVNSVSFNGASSYKKICMWEFLLSYWINNCPGHMVFGSKLLQAFFYITTKALLYGNTQYIHGLCAAWYNCMCTYWFCILCIKNDFLDQSWSVLYLLLFNHHAVSEERICLLSAFSAIRGRVLIDQVHIGIIMPVTNCCPSCKCEIHIMKLVCPSCDVSTSL